MFGLLRLALGSVGIGAEVWIRIWARLKVSAKVRVRVGVRRVKARG